MRVVARLQLCWWNSKNTSLALSLSPFLTSRYLSSLLSIKVSDKRSLSLSSLGPLGFLLSIKVSFTAFVMVNSLSSLLQCTELLEFKLNFSLFKIIWVILLFCFVCRFILYVCTGFVAQIKIRVLSKFLRFNFYNAQSVCMYACHCISNSAFTNLENSCWYWFVIHYKINWFYGL